MGWQPISTAPRDGQKILAFNSSHKEVQLVCWQEGNDIEPEAHWDDVGKNHGWPPRIFYNANFFQFWHPIPDTPDIEQAKESAARKLTFHLG